MAHKESPHCSFKTFKLGLEGKELSGTAEGQLIWRCVKCRGSLLSKLPVSYGYFFEGLKTSAQKIIYLAAQWIENPQKTVRDVAREMSPDFVADCYSWFRDMAQAWSERKSSQQRFRLGGPNAIVEIDETLLYKAKYNRGRIQARHRRKERKSQNLLSTMDDFFIS